jgi:hypothetical protein
LEVYSAKHCVLYDIYLNKKLILSVFVIIIIFFPSQPCYSWERRKEKSDHVFD